jgi:hypothetical protein
MSSVGEWLLIEWPRGEGEPTKYWLSTLADDRAFDRLVDIAKLRWRIERDYQELKQEVLPVCHLSEDQRFIPACAGNAQLKRQPLARRRRFIPVGAGKPGSSARAAPVTAVKARNIHSAEATRRRPRSSTALGSVAVS